MFLYSTAFTDQSLEDDSNLVDDVKNESIIYLFPATSHSEKHDEFRLNLTRSEFYRYFNHAWNDMYWLAHAIIWMGFVGVLAQHHAQLHMELTGARMRIASCSLIYRKVGTDVKHFRARVRVRIMCFSCIIFITESTAVSIVGQHNRQRLLGEFNVE